jgi:hypothetical protein
MGKNSVLAGEEKTFDCKTSAAIRGAWKAKVPINIPQLRLEDQSTGGLVGLPEGFCGERPAPKHKQISDPLLQIQFYHGCGQFARPMGAPLENDDQREFYLCGASPCVSNTPGRNLNFYFAQVV